MNYKQKLGYMALGAGILALGIIIGQWGTPDIKAQSTDLSADFDDIDAPPSNRRFNKITCRELEVVDKNGNKAIVLFTGGVFRGRGIKIYDRKGNPTVVLSSDDLSNKLYLIDSQSKLGVALDAGLSGNAVGDHVANINSITVHSPLNKGNVTLFATDNPKEGKPLIMISDKAGNVEWAAP